MFGGLGMGEMILIFLVVLLLFGAKRLPEIGSSLGKGIREFKTSMRDVEGEIKAAARPTYAPPLPAPAQTSQTPAQIAPAAPVAATPAAAEAAPVHQG